MNSIIEVNGIKLYANHGCLDEEAVIGGNYVVDVKLEADLSEASASDDLTKTIDYVTVNQIVEREMAIRSKLIEHVGKRIQDALVAEFTQLEYLWLKVEKVAPPINGNVDSVSVILTWEKP